MPTGYWDDAGVWHDTDVWIESGGGGAVTLYAPPLLAVGSPILAAALLGGKPVLGQRAIDFGLHALASTR